MRLEVREDWRGNAAAADGLARATFHLSVVPHALRLEIQARAFGDPPPSTPPGRQPGLWGFEVVELFLLGEDERYLELEFGPHGHWLALSLRGPRGLEHDDVMIDPSFRRPAATQGANAERWSVAVDLPFEILPPAVARLNAYTIDGMGEERRHWAWRAVPGPQPDFHRLERFAPLEPELRVALERARAAARGD